MHAESAACSPLLTDSGPAHARRVNSCACITRPSLRRKTGLRSWTRPRDRGPQPACGAALARHTRRARARRDVGALADREMQRRLAAGAAGLRREAAGMRAEGAGLRQQLAELAGLVPMQLERVRAALGQTLQQKARSLRSPTRARAAAAARAGGRRAHARGRRLDLSRALDWASPHAARGVCVTLCGWRHPQRLDR